MSDADLAVLNLLIELGPASGYRMLAIVAERGMAAWAGLSATSVYNGLRRLRRAKLAHATKDSKKRGKGPVGMLFSATALGRAAARRQVATALVEAREHSATFKVALAFSGVLCPARIAALLRRRAQRLRRRVDGVEAARRSQRDSSEPLGATLIFEYVLAGLEHEIAMAERLANLAEDSHETA